LFDNTDEDHSNVKFVNGKNISITGVGGNTNSITIDHEEIDTEDVTITNKVDGAT
jgi:shikimate 5-dehydrogenase